MNMTKITDNIIMFIFGGNCSFVLTADKEHYSYKVVRKNTNDGSKVFQCYIRDGGKTKYCGYFKIVGNSLSYRHNNKYKVEPTADAVVLLRYVIQNRNKLPDNIGVYHIGRCAHCGRMLVDPKSMELGFGPKCWVKVRHFVKNKEEA